MKVRQIKHQIIILTGCLLFSCTQENNNTDVGKELAVLHVEVNVPDVPVGLSKMGMRSSVTTRSFSDQTLTDLHVFIFNSVGDSTGHGFVTGSSISNVSTLSGTGCTVYAITNTVDDDMSSFGGLPATKTAMEEMVTPNLVTMDDICANEQLVMSGSTTVDIVSGSNTLSDMIVKRLAAGNTLNITCQSGVILTGYRIGNLPVRSWCIARSNANEGVASDAVEGDDAIDPAVSTDWLTTDTLPSSGITTGTTPPYILTFYMYENRRGSRIQVGGTTGDESNQAQKTTYAPDRATYVDLFVNVGGADVVHRLYLGGTPYATNYNVKRNCLYTYNISIGPVDGLVVSTINVQNWETTTGGSASI